jgi:hypothetical protein
MSLHCLRENSAAWLLVAAPALLALALWLALARARARRRVREDKPKLQPTYSMLEAESMTKKNSEQLARALTACISHEACCERRRVVAALQRQFGFQVHPACARRRARIYAVDEVSSCRQPQRGTC